MSQADAIIFVIKIFHALGWDDMILTFLLAHAPIINALPNADKQKVKDYTNQIMSEIVTAGGTK